jgi:hypothetical protein
MQLTMKTAPGLRIWVCRVLAVAMAFGLAGADALAKKKKDKKARLKEIEAVYVQGYGPAVAYIEQNLGQETCLVGARTEEDADAVLEIRQDTRPCRSALRGLCVEITALLTDRQTDKVIWFRTDSNIGSRSSIGVDDSVGKWVLWNLNGACCKNR